MSNPRRNRVTPSGELIATSARGKWMGNRGCLHDEEGNIGRRRWTTKSWVCCSLNFNGWTRQLMAPGQYTELFFLDEVTALAAGHRPCATCRRGDYNKFMEMSGMSSATDVNQALHSERTLPLDERPRVVLKDLPDGVIITRDLGVTFTTMWRGRTLRWSTEGYHLLESSDFGEATLVTPSLVVSALNAGYQPEIHPSAG